MRRYPVQIQGDRDSADDAFSATMCHVFDAKSETMVFEAFTRTYLHVIAWDAEGNVVRTYDNR